VESGGGVWRVRMVSDYLTSSGQRCDGADLSSPCRISVMYYSLAPIFISEKAGANEYTLLRFNKEKTSQRKKWKENVL